MFRKLPRAAIKDAVNVFLWYKQYKNHPVYIQARKDGIPETAIRPVAIYFDGVMCTKRDGAECWYFVDLFSSIQSESGGKAT